MKIKLHRLVRHAAMILLGLVALTSLSCERDVFWVDDNEGNGKPVDIILEFELPQQDEVAVTRTLTDIDEHHINDFYLLIFDAEGKRLFGKYYPNYDMQKVDYQGGEWSSVAEHPSDMDKANSTHGHVIARASTGTIYIYGFANIGDSTDEDFEPTNTLEAAAVKTNLKEGLSSTRWKLDHLLTKDELFEVQVDAMSEAKDNILVREKPNLMYSGAWSKFTTDDDYLNKTKEAGKVVIDPSWADSNGNVDLRGRGMVYLRTLTAHYKFNIEINETVFSAFEPESWQIINLPKRVYLMDQHNESQKPVKRAEIDFKASTVMKNHMVHEDAKYVFDFWMFENHKEARTVSGTSEKSNLTNSLKYAVKGSEYVNDDNAVNKEYKDHYLDNEDEVGEIVNHYKDRFGNTLMQWEKSSGVPLDWLKTVYGYESYKANKHGNYGYYPTKSAGELTDEEKAEIDNKAIIQFLYNKRELQAKRWTKNNLPVWNRAGDYYPYAQEDGHPGYDSEINEYTRMRYDSKKFIYAVDKATYVVIKGRLRFNTSSAVTLTNMASNYQSITEGEYLEKGEPETFSDGYVDVTYTIHLGDMRDNNGDGLPDYDNFNCLRNTEYIYNVKINNVNSIYTTCETSGESANNIRVKKQHGADGLMNMAKGVVYNTDAHFCQFNMMLTKESLNDFFFEMNTPWNSFSTEDFYVTVNTVDENDNPVVEKRFIYTDHITKHKTLGGGSVNDYTVQDMNRVKKIISNPDFTWFKFSPNTDQQGMFDAQTVFNNKKTTYDKVRQTEKYNRALSGITLWNLYEFTQTMEALVQAEEDAKPTLESEYSSDTAKARMAALLAQRFECTVGDGAGNDYTGAHALPFMLDEVTYEVDEDVYNKVLYNVGHDSNLAQYQTPSSNAGKYYVTEDYTKYLKIEESSNFSEREIAPIRRMFYTVYLDEYYYYEQPYGVTSWVKPYWKHFANQPSRYVNFGYRGEGYTTEGRTAAGFMLSSDRQSGIMVTLLTIVQPSIQTFYSTERINTNEKYEVAIGMEHVNETHDPRWTDALKEIPTTGMSTYNGWAFSWENIQDVNWDDYVGYETYDAENGLMNNVIMKSSNNDLPTPSSRVNTKTNVDGDNPYLAGAVRMCMNRNRDENGNGKIDKSELKWFLPTSRQYELAGLGHYSLQDPLFDYNNSVNYIPAGMVPEYDEQTGTGIKRHGAHILDVNNLQAQNAWKYNYVASDYQTLLSQEMMNSPTYGIDADYQSRPYEMRCTRNLGGEYEDNDSGLFNEDNDYSIPEYPYNLVSSRHQSLLFNYNVYTKIFEMTYYDSRSVRGIFYTAEELPKHFLFSTTNLPYYRFKVAANALNIQPAKGLTYQEIIENLNPCRDYSEEPDGSDRRSWRMPNHAELGLMVTQLRQYNEKQVPPNYRVDDIESWFFNQSLAGETAAHSNEYFFSTTSWNFTGYWARMMSVNYNTTEGWGIHATNPSSQKSYPNLQGNFEPDMGQFKGYFYVRCVKDVRSDINNYKEFNSSSENYGQGFGSDNEGYGNYGGSDSEGFN